MDKKPLLAGQSAIVTGAGRGIGAAIAEALAAAGASVALNYSQSEGACKGVCERIESAGGTAFSIKADVSSEADVQAMFKETIKRFGTVDILVNNAGVQIDAPFEQMTLDQWNKLLAINLTGQFLCAREAVREFLRRGVVAERSAAAGKIICISSVHEVIPWAGHINYAAAKGGIGMMMRTMAQEMASRHIRVNAIGPGAVRTDINRNAWDTPDAEANLLKLIPYGRVADPVDIGKVAVWLASDESDYMTGQTLFVDGGMVLYPGFRDAG